MTPRPKPAPRITLALLGLLCAASAPAPAFADPKRVAVLYFDNNTGNHDYDVLQKGLADMFITDLSAVESLEVVEREKLQALIDELKLQRSRFFDPKTAQQIGRGAGAQFAVTGAFAAIDPTMRIDVRLIEVATGKVVVADKVSGDRKAFFDLQQELVDRFVAGLEVKLKASARARSGATDVETLLKYSRGVDAGDRGDLKAASTALGEIVRDAPEFKLAQTRYTALLRKLEAAGRKRTGVRAELIDELLKICDARTAGGWQKAAAAGPQRESLGTYLGYKAARANLFLHLLTERLQGRANTHTGVILLPPEERPEIQAWMASFYEAEEQFITDAMAVLERFPALEYQNLPESIADEDRAKFQQLNLLRITDKLGRSAGEAEAWLALFALTGRSPNLYFTVAPTLAEVDKGIVKRSFSHLDHALAFARKWKGEDPGLVLDMYGEALVGVGRNEQAVARWQELLDSFPTHPKYKEVETKIKEALCATEACRSFRAAVETCSGPLVMAAATQIPLVTKYEKAPGLRRLFETARQKCPPKDPVYPHLPYNLNQAALYQYIGLAAPAVSDCKLRQEALDWLHKAGAQMQANGVEMFKACQ